MPANLLIVESPSKAKTLKKYLGNDFEILASYGHVRGLVRKDGSVDTEHDFKMKYQVIDKNKKSMSMPFVPPLKMRRTCFWQLTRIAKVKRSRAHHGNPER